MSTDRTSRDPAGLFATRGRHFWSSLTPQFFRLRPTTLPREQSSQSSQEAIEDSIIKFTVLRIGQADLSPSDLKALRQLLDKRHYGVGTQWFNPGFKKGQKWEQHTAGLCGNLWPRLGSITEATDAPGLTPEARTWILESLLGAIPGLAQYAGSNV